jgi:hypothetical protein
MIWQADVEVSFEVVNLNKAELFDPVYENDTQKLCCDKGAGVRGGVGTFGLSSRSSLNIIVIVLSICVYVLRSWIIIIS